MEAYAVIATGGKQYRVKAKDTLQVELLKAEPGQQIDMTPVLALSDGATLRVGKPHIEGAKVVVSVVKHVRGEKLISFKKKRRKGFKKKKGHRQDLTMIKVESIQ
jgi:large subunit ribosomal protein L21